MRAILAALVLLGWVIVVAPGTPARADGKKPTEKTHIVSFNDAKWDDVFDWYERATGLKAQVKVKPKGTVTLQAGSNRKLTAAQVTDLLNEPLMKQNLLLIPGRTTFTVVSGDGKIDPTLIRVVELADLHKLGKTALVEVTIPLTIDVGEEIGAELPKYLTPFGELRSVTDKSVVVRDTVDNILRLQKLLQPL